MNPSLSKEPHFEANEDTIHAKFISIRRELDRLEHTLKLEMKKRKQTERELKEIKILRDEEERKRKRSESNMQQLVAMLKLNTAKCSDFMEESIAETKEIDISDNQKSTICKKSKPFK